MIYTSNFASYRKYQHLTQISIARYPIKGFGGLDIQQDHSFEMLRPSVALLSHYKQGNMTDAEYAKQYYYQIKDCDWDAFFVEYDECVLLCYEKAGDFCHRHVLSFILRKLGYNIKEL